MGCFKDWLWVRNLSELTILLWSILSIFQVDWETPTKRRLEKLLDMGAERDTYLKIPSCQVPGWVQTLQDEDPTMENILKGEDSGAWLLSRLCLIQDFGSAPDLRVLV